jgi:hypothetical protein
MGIILTDIYPLPSGIELPNVYISFFEEQLFIRPTFGPDGKSYMVSAVYRIYKNYDAKIINLQTVDRETIMNTTYNLNDAYTVLYNALKQKYPNSIDKFEDDSNTTVNNTVESNTT